MVTSSERHNQLSREFVMKVARETETHAHLMVVIESTILATMLLSSKLYHYDKATSVEMVQVAIEQAIVRFTEEPL